MSKKKKHKKERPEKKTSLLWTEKRRRNGKKMINILLLFVVFEVIYQVVLQLEKKFWPLYPMSVFVLFFIILVLFVIYLIMNRGEPNKKVTPEMLSPSLPHETRVIMAEKYNERKAKSAALVYFIVPLSFVLALDFIMLFVSTGAATI